jgi:ATP-dependent protease HslVU (ClpYQ) peptidase subunit
MTVLIGLEHESRVYIGADSRTTTGWEASTQQRPKVFRLGTYLIAATGRCRFADLLEFGFDAPQDESGKYDTRFMVRSFVPTLRTLLKDHGAMGKTEETEAALGGFLVGAAGHLYHVCEDFAVTSSDDGLMAIGSGSPYALGAMEARKDMPPRDRILLALEVAAKFNIGCGPPYVVMEV